MEGVGEGILEVYYIKRVCGLGCGACDLFYVWEGMLVCVRR